MLQFLFVSIFVAVILVFLFKSFLIIEKDEEAVIERFGSFNRVIGEGVHLIIPFFEKVHGIVNPANHRLYLHNGKISLQEELFEFPNDNREFFGKDKSNFKIKADVVYQITDPYKAVYETVYLFDALNQLFAGIIQKKLVDLADGTDSFDFIQNFADECVKIANDYSTNWGVKILEFNLKQITESNGIRHDFD